MDARLAWDQEAGGSTPLTLTTILCGTSSFGRAPVLQAGGGRIETCVPYPPSREVFDGSLQDISGRPSGGRHPGWKKAATWA